MRVKLKAKQKKRLIQTAVSDLNSTPVWDRPRAKKKAPCEPFLLE